MLTQPRSFVIERTGELVAAYVSRNAVPAADLSALIVTVYTAVVNLQRPSATATSTVTMPTASEVTASVCPDHIVSFIDGKGYKVLKRHLATHGLTPERYRSRYGLPHDYPMVAPSYAAHRSHIAKRTGLGQKAV